MDSHDAALQGVARVFAFIAALPMHEREKVTAVRVKVANYESQSDLDFFKEPNKISLKEYHYAVDILQGECISRGWEFAEEFLNPDTFVDTNTYHGVGNNRLGSSPRMRYIVQMLTKDNTVFVPEFAAGGLAPIVLDIGFNPLGKKYTRSMCFDVES